ncbi:DUF4249 domain-containing protein [Snuella sedimenti]|uniref:DUF4249 domain-containing protein n=1 Tax=Snuella sedimenti TaxID=2798802 RepID=A0A8J7IHY3_9FLAO|nr:DUF4249 domain-containing protein [Snuella sedimenti]MBJ6368988.1 DUF4249 domain-containing protein [Snuella sedimenti]
MKRISTNFKNSFTKNFVYILALSFLSISCEDVIKVEVPKSKPKLVINASLNWFKGSDGTAQYIQLTLSAPYFDNTVPPATGAIVTVTDSNNNTFIFTEEDNTGIYRTNNFIAVINGTYNLNIIYKDELYTGAETLIPVSDIDYVEQKNNGGFSGEETEIKAYYKDPKDIENYYFFEFINTDTEILSLEVYDDEFNDGNEIFAFHSSEDLNTGNELIIRNFGISKRFYNFMNILLQQSDDESGDPFETQPASVRGNCVNITNPDNYPLGYFRASEVASFQYIVE